MGKKFFSYSEIIKSGDKTSKVQILKTWKWKHSSYWEFSINERDLKEFKQNFDDKVRGVDLAVDVGHDFNHKAVGWFKELMIEGKKLFATIEWNHEGLYLVKEKVYKYFSPELHFEFQDEETGKVIKNLLSGWGITNRPFFKNMEALEASEEGDTQNKWKHYFFNLETMKNFKEFFEANKDKESLSFSEMEAGRLAFTELSEADQNIHKEDMSKLESKFKEDEETEEKEKKKDKKEKKMEEKVEKEGEKWDKKEEKKVEGEKKGDKKEEKKDKWDKKFTETEKQFSELCEKNLGMTLDEVKSAQKKFSELSLYKKKQEINDKLGSFMFSEENKKGYFLPKSKDNIVNFVSKLNDNLASEFFEIIKDSIAPLSFKEIGGEGKEAMEFNIPNNTPNGVWRESFVLDYVAKKFSIIDKTSIEEAVMKAQSYIVKNSIK